MMPGGLGNRCDLGFGGLFLRGAQEGRLTDGWAELLRPRLRFWRHSGDDLGTTNFVSRDAKVPSGLANAAGIASTFTDTAPRNLRIVRGFLLSPPNDLRPPRY